VGRTKGKWQPNQTKPNPHQRPSESELSRNADAPATRWFIVFLGQRLDMHISSVPTSVGRANSCRRICRTYRAPLVRKIRAVVATAAAKSAAAAASYSQVLAATFRTKLSKTS